MAPPTDDEPGLASPPAEHADASSTDETEDDAPDLARLAILSCVLLGLIAFWLYTSLHPPPRKFYTDLPGLRLDGLTNAQLAAVLEESNAMNCDCGSSTCHYSVAECRHMEQTACDVSLKLGAIIIRKVTGKEAQLTQAMPPPMPAASSSAQAASAASPAASSSAEPAAASPAAAPASSASPPAAQPPNP